MQLLMNLYKAVERKQGENLKMRWWEQALIDLAGVRETVVVAAESNVDGLEE